MQGIQRQRRGNSGLTEARQRAFRRIVAVFVVLALCSIFFAPGAGLVSLMRKELLRHRAAEEIAGLEEQNQALREEIRRFNEDSAFLERAARDNDFVKEGELVFDFGKSEKKH